MITIHRIEKHTFMITAIRSNGLTILRLGISPGVIDEKLACDHVVISEKLPTDVGLEYEYVNCVPTDFDYLSVPRAAAKFKEALGKIGAIKIPIAEVKNYKAPGRLNPEERIAILFQKNRNITCTYKGEVVFNLNRALKESFGQYDLSLKKFKAILILCKVDPTRISLLTSMDRRDRYRLEIKNELQSNEISVDYSRVYLQDLATDKDIPLNFHGDIPISFNAPTDNTIYIKTNRDIAFDSPIELRIKQNDMDAIKFPLKISEKNRVNEAYLLRCHPPYFENYIFNKIKLLEKCIRYHLLGQI